MLRTDVSVHRKRKVCMKPNNALTVTRALWMAIAAIAVNAQCTYAAEITWGGASGNWHDSGKWIGGVKPVEGDAAVFPAGGEYTVVIDNKTAELSYVKVLPGLVKDLVIFTDEDPTDETLRSLYVVGDGYRFIVGENRGVRIRGNTVQLGKNGYDKTYLDVGPNAELSLDSGRLYVRNGGILVNTNATLNIRGGNLDYAVDSDYLKLAKGATVNFMGGSNIVGRIANRISSNNNVVVSEFDGDGSKVTFSGGYTEFPNVYAFSSFVDLSKTEFRLTGGVLDLYQRIVRGCRTILPAKGAEMRNRALGLSMTDDNGNNDVWELGGKAYFTATNSYVNLGWGTDTIIKGGGEFSATSIHQGSNDVYADLGRINIATNFEAYSNSGHLYFQDGITFGTYGDVKVNPKKSARFVPCGRVKFDTVDSMDGTTLRSFDLSSRFDFSNATSFEVEGAGTVGVVPEVAFRYLHRFSVDAGATVALTNARAKIVASLFDLGAGATLLVGSNAVDVASVAQLGEGAKIRYGFETLEAGKMYPLWFGPHGTLPPTACFEFYPALPEGWTIAVSGSTAYLSDGTVVESDGIERHYWLGVNGGNWNDPNNWPSNVPANNISNYARFTGNRQLSVTNDYNSAYLWMRSLQMTASAGPYIVSGKPLAPTYPQNWAESAASVDNNSVFPFTIESQLYKHYRADKDTVRSYFKVKADGDAPIVMAGGGCLTNAVLRFLGDVRIGGNWEMLGLYPASGTSRDTRLVLLPGGYLETTEQGSNQTVTASYQVSSGAGMTINGTVWRWTTKENTHFVDGVVTSTCPVQATARQTFIGDGVLSLAMVQSDSEGSGDLKFAEEVTVRPAGWKTVRADADNPMTMVVRDNATIGAWGDWTYGAETGFESSTSPADRALRVVGGAKTCVSFDTEGNTVTLTDPLVVEKWSTVLKKGEGALVFKSDENDLADSEIELRGGELRLSGPETFGKLTFSGGKIALEDGFNADAYTPVFTAKKIVGEVAVAGRYNVRTVADDSGVTVSVRRKRGTAVILR